MKRITEAFGQESMVMVIAGNISSVLIGSIIWIVLAGVLPVSDYGRANYILSLGAFLSTFTLLGFNVTLRTYLPRGRDEILPPSILLTSLISMILGMPFINLHPSIPLIIFSNSIFILLTSERLGHLKYRDFFILQTVTRVLQIILIILIVPISGLDGAIYSITLPFTLFSIPMLLKARGGFRGIKGLLSYFRFSLLSYLSGIVGALGTRFDKVLIGSLYGERALGHYQLAFQFYSAMQSIPTALGSYILPMRSSGRSTKTQEMIGFSLSVLTSIAGYFLIPIFVKVLFPNFYPESALAGKIVSLAIIFDSLYSIYSSRRLSEEDPRSVLVASMLSIPILFSSIYFLGSSLGIEGLAISILLYRISALSFMILVTRISWLRVAIT
jgi:O-antigen/teichoic acid export membrane protein